MDREERVVEAERARAARDADTRAPETAREPAPGIVHEPEPDAENIMPAQDEPGTL